MICIHPTVASNTLLIQSLERDTGLTSQHVRGLTFAVLAPANVIVLPKPKAKRSPTLFNYNGGGDAA